MSMATSMDMENMKKNVQRVCDFVGTDLKEITGDIYSQGMQEGMVVDKVFIDESGFANVDFLVPTERWMRNTFDIMHGGAVATLVDFYSSMAMAGDPANYKDSVATSDEIAHVLATMGVSRNLQMHYLAPTPLNTTILLRCRIILNTKRNALMEVFFFHNGKCLIEGTHDKAKTVPSI